MIKHRCHKCLWWDNVHERLNDEPNNYGLCRKHKPVIYRENGKYYGGWPMTDTNDLCGEFREDI